MNPLADLALFAGVTYQEVSPTYFPYVPQWSASAGVAYTLFKHLHINIDCLYLDDHFVASRARREEASNTSRVDSYFLLNGKVSYDFTIRPLGLGVEVFVAGENLIDDKYEVRKGYHMPGINGMFGVILSL